MKMTPGKFINPKSRKGNAMIFVILAFALVMIFAASIAFMFSTNLTQTVRQEESSQAYYIALSGVDLARSALAKENAGGIRLISSFWNSSGNLILSSSGITDTITVESGGEVIGTASIRIDASGTGAAKQVIITSTGTHTQSGTSRTLTLKLTNIDSFPYMNENWE